MTLTRRHFLATTAAGAASWAAPARFARAQAEITIRIAKQFGLGYLQLMLMEDMKLVEKHANAAGVQNAKVEYNTFRSSDVMNDALISNNLDVASLGIPGMATIWSRTRGNIDVRGASGLNRLPLFLLVRDPAIKSIRDFKDSHRIALPAVRVSMQAVFLQMLAAREWGEAEFRKLDPLTVSLAHPDATTMMLGGSSEIAANFSSMPFQYRQMKNPNIRKLLSSEDIAGPMSFNVLGVPARFRSQNPKLFAAFLAAFDEATTYINADIPRAAEAYLRLSNDKSPKEEIVAIMSQPDVKFTGEPFDLSTMLDFMAKVGSLKNPPADWRKEMMWPEAFRKTG